MRHVIAFTATNRADYLRHTLDTWRQVRGIDQAHLIFRCEPGCDEVVDICRSADFGADLCVTVNETRQGPLTNPWLAMEDGWSHADMHDLDFVIIGEDDTPVSTDILEFYSWAQETYRSDQQVITACGFMHEAKGGYADVIREPHFSAWIWGTWRDRWYEKLRGDWDHNYRAKGWDWRITEYWMEELGYRSINPAMSRSQDIGQYGGVHAHPDNFVNAVSRCWTQDVPPQDYREMQ